MRIYSNNAVATVLGDDINESATTIPVGDTTGWPEPGVGEVAVAVIDFHNPATREVVTYTGKTALSITGVTRGVDGTTARTHFVAPTPPVVVHAGSAADLQQVQTNDDRLDAIEAEPSSLSLGLRGIVTFNEDGSFEKGDYPWLRAVKVRAIGGGGAGGGAVTTGSGENATGGGGGGGGYAESLIEVASLNPSEDVVVGDGGSPVAGGSGGSGAASSFGSHLTAEGGGGGGPSSAVTAPFGLNGATGNGGGGSGDFVVFGSDGLWATPNTSINARGGHGAGSVLGGFSRTTNSNSANGGAGRLYGGGGSGAQNSTNQGTARPGGAGREGIVIVELYG